MTAELIPSQALSPLEVFAGEDRFRSVVENTFDIIVILNATGRVVYESPSMRRVLGYDPSERLGRSALDLIHPDDAPTIRQGLAQVLEGHCQRSRGELRARHKDGSWRNIEWTSTSLLYDPNVRGIVCIARDVTERRAGEQERMRLLASERLARAAAERSLDQLLSLQSLSDVLAGAVSPTRVAALVTEHGVVALGAVAGTVGIVGAAAESIDVLAHKANPPITRGQRQRSRVEAALPLAESVRLQKPIWIESAAAWNERYPQLAVKRPRHYRAVAVSPFAISGRVSGALALVFDEDRRFSDTDCLFMWLMARQCGQALERARLYQEVAEREQRLQELVRRLIVGQEEERRRIAYELHDGLAQVAASTHQHLQVLATRFPPTCAEQRDELQRAVELAQRTVREARSLIRGLRPTVLDDFGLVRALLVELEALQADGWRVTFDQQLGNERLPTEIETALYRVLQEALTNIRKHAGPTPVHVSLRRQGQHVRLRVRDRGVGFDPVEVRRSADTRQGLHVGLTGMQERVSLLHGRWMLRSAPGRGTSIDVTLPWRVPAELLT